MDHCRSQFFGGCLVFSHPQRNLMRRAVVRRLDGDYAVPAALAAKAVGKPVKMVCTRADDMRFDCPRSPSMQILRMAFGDGGRVTAMDHHAAAGWPTAAINPAFMLKDARGVPFDAFAIWGAEALHDYTNFLLAQDSAADCGIGPVLSAFSAAGEDYRDLVGATDFVFFRSCAEKLLLNDPQLRNHSGTSHEHLRKQFQRLDREFLALRRQLLASKLCSRSIPEGNSIGRVRDLTELALVRQIAGQTRPRITLRELFLRAGRAIQGLKPCWMMSPMSIAQFLEPGKLHFDLLLMDEASQIRPEEALGAIARAAQVVIVGDQMQLPPTPFFQKLSTDSTDDDEEIEDTKQESVLEAAASRFFPPRRLKWH